MELNRLIRVKEKQYQDPILLEMKKNVHNKRVLSLQQRGDGVFRYQCRLCVPMVDRIQKRIKEKTHSSRYSIHPSSTKMYCDLTKVYYWNGMKKGTAEFVSKSAKKLR